MKIRPQGDELFHADGQMHSRTDGQTGNHNEVEGRFLQCCERA
jgi:hypothetical protein